jgi:hypothetical protein
MNAYKRAHTSLKDNIRINESYLFYQNTLIPKLRRLSYFSKYPLYPEADHENAPFFIIGSGRSGSTLLRSILCNNVDIFIPPESYVLPKTISLFIKKNYLSWDKLVGQIIDMFQSHKEFYTWEINIRPLAKKISNVPNRDRNLFFIIDSIYKCYGRANSPGRSRWGDKTPSNTLNLNLLSLAFPNCRYVNLIRDGRDVVLSYLHYSIYRTVKHAAWRWNKSLDMTEKFRDRIDILDIRYEDLVRDPPAEIKRVCAFLQIDYVDNMLETIEKDLGDVKYHEHHKNVCSEITTDSIGKWRNLSNDVMGEIERYIAPNLKKYGYSA